ncbi:hypothetical protein HOO65_070217 [Ceratocystis lukuohia]|uniref:Magnesium transporter NIPA8 n=1 Tax=Ceratocystis lukuohia TaxID=2019550 RepID=A0ABR4MBV2_9PEZI
MTQDGDGDDAFLGSTIVIGIFVGILSTSIQSIGLTLQRKSHILEDIKSPLARRAPHLRRRWQIGMAMFITANLLGSSVQISTLPLPVLSTLQASGLVFNGLCATLILAEPFTRLSLIGTVLVCLGALLIAVFGAIPAPTHDLPELLDLMRRRPFVAWMTTTLAIVIIVAITTDVFTAWAVRRRRFEHNPRFRLARGLAYGCISGVLSAHLLLVAKSAVELIIKTVIDGDNQFVHWQSWMAVIALVSLAIIQLSYMHRGLKLVSTSVFYPLVFCVYNIIAILDGLIYFEQTDCISTLDASLIALGTAILLSGVLALSWRLSDDCAQAQGAQPRSPSTIGFVEDTEEESLLESESPSLIPSPLASPTSTGIGPGAPQLATYQTFSPRVESYAEIWDELHDQHSHPTSPITASAPNRRSLSSIADEGTSLLSNSHAKNRKQRRSIAGSGTQYGNYQVYAHSHSHASRRKSSNISASGVAGSGPTPKPLQDAVGGLFKMRWFSRKDKAKSEANEHSKTRPHDGESQSNAPWPVLPDAAPSPSPSPSSPPPPPPPPPPGTYGSGAHPPV